MDSLGFRQADTSDFSVLAGIISTTEAWTCYGIDYDTAVSLFEQMEDTIFLATRDNRIVGFITIRENGVGNIGAYVRMVAVAAHFRGQGIGEKLIDFACERAFQRTPNLFLICSVENIKAQAFYERVGFLQVGILRDLVVNGHDEILYRMTEGAMR